MRKPEFVKEITEEWETEDYIKNIPPMISAIFVSLVAVIYLGDFALLAVATLFAVIVGATPYFIYNYIQLRRLREMEDQLPNFLRDLVEAVKSGMTLTAALEHTTRSDYGKLSDEIEQIYYQMSWGIPFDEAMSNFAERQEESALINRAVRIIIEARRSGGDVVAIMETVANDTAVIKEAEKERKSRTSQQVFIMYVIYFMFIVITIALTKILVPIGELSGLAGGGGGQLAGAGSIGVGAGGPCAGAPPGAAGAVCSFFGAISRVFNMGGGVQGYYRALFLSMLFIQGIFSGLIAGQIGEDSVFAGVKHAMIMTSVGFAVFLLAFRLGIA